MFLSLLTFEVAFHLQKRLFWVGVLAFSALGFLISMSQGRSDIEIWVNAPSALVIQLGTLSLGLVFVAAYFANAAFLRDDQHRIGQLVWSTPAPRQALFWSRYAGALIASGLVFLAAPLFMLVDVLISLGGPRKLGPIEPQAYLWVLATLSVPTLVFATSLMTAIALWSRHWVAVFCVAIALYLGYFVAAFYAGSPLMAGATPSSPVVMALAGLLDPFGISAYFEQVKSWTILERNTQLFDFDASLAQNRALWLGVSVLALMVGARLFGPALTVTGARPQAEPVKNPVPPMPLAKIKPDQTMGWKLRAVWAMAKLEARFLYRSWLFAAILLMWCVGIVPEMLTILSQYDFGTSRYPTTTALLNRFQYDFLPFFGTVFLIFLSSESVWRERGAGIHQLVGAAPVSSLTLFASRALALCCFPLILISSAILFLLAIQVLHGWSQLDLGLLASLYVFEGLPLMAAALVALFCQVACGGRYAGMIVAALLLFGIAGLPGEELGLEHPLFRIASIPGLASSAMTGHSHALSGYLSYTLFWLALGALLSCLTVLLWPRGGGRAPFKLGGLVRNRFAVALAGFVAILGAVISVNVYEAGYQSSFAREAQRADFEKRYGRFIDAPRLSVETVSTELDFYPSEQRAMYRGTFGLVNKTDQPISEVFVVLGRRAERLELAVENATINRYDDDHQAWIFDLNTALRPDERTQLTFEIDWAQSGFGRTSGRFQLVENGSLIVGPAYHPAIGFPSALRLRGSERRARHGLPPLAGIARLEDRLLQDSQGETAGRVGNYDMVRFETTVSTSADEHALAPGTLVKAWEEGGRRYFRYRAAGPISDVPYYASARYRCEADSYEAIALEVCYTADRAQNVGAILSAMKDSIAYGDAHLGDYPHQVMRAVQVSSLTGLRGFAAPTGLLMSEDSVFEYQKDAKRQLVDQIYRIVGHETSHQWWGHWLIPARSDHYEGSMVVVESLARYSELMLLEAKHGLEGTRPWLQYEIDRYFYGRGRARRSEPPLYRTNGQAYLSYSKGAAAMYAMKSLMGEARVNAALARLIRDHATTQIPATSLDLITRLEEGASEDQRRMIAYWFKKIAVTDGAVVSAEAEQTGAHDSGGAYRLTLKVNVTHTETDGLGKVVGEALSTPITLLIKGPGEERRVTVAADAVAADGSVLRFDLSFAPTSVILDPDFVYLDPDRGNNTAPVRFVP